MGRITAIEPALSKRGHVTLVVDGVAAATVPADLVARLGLTVGSSYDAEGAGSEPAGEEDKELARVVERAVGLLAYRGKSSEELRRRLVEKGEDPKLAEAAVAKLIERGLLDDAGFAAAKARAGVAGGARSRFRVEQDLARRGIARDVAREAVNKVLVEEGTDEAQVAERAARKKLRSIGQLDPRAQRQKLFAFLARQGFSMDATKRAVNAVLSGAAAGGDEEDAVDGGDVGDE